MPQANITREQVVEEARTWLGTPFRHQGMIKGHGTDCIGMMRGIAINLDLLKDVGVGSLKVKPYLGYGKSPVPSKFLGILREYMVEVRVDEVLPADLLLFRGRIYPTHLAMVTDVGIIHCAMDFGKVVEHRMDKSWLKRRCFGFRFPIFVE